MPKIFFELPSNLKKRSVQIRWILHEASLGTAVSEITGAYFMIKECAVIEGCKTSRRLHVEDKVHSSVWSGNKDSLPFIKSKTQEIISFKSWGWPPYKRICSLDHSLYPRLSKYNISLLKRETLGLNFYGRNKHSFLSRLCYRECRMIEIQTTINK